MGPNQTTSFCTAKETLKKKKNKNPKDNTISVLFTVAKTWKQVSIDR